MSSSHVLVLTSIIASLVLGTCILFYRFVYPKKKIPLLMLLLVISFLPIVSMIRPGSYESGDLSTHVRNAIAFYNVLRQGEVFPIWAGDMNGTYGYPAFLFMYIVPYYAVSLIHSLGLSFLISTKLFLGLAYILSGIFMYLFLKEEVSEKSAFIGALFYLFAPYHLVDLHFRTDIGEITAFIFLPLALLAAKKFLVTFGVKWFLLEVVAITLLILSHPAISLSGIPVLIVYIIFFYLYARKGKVLFLQLLIFFISLLLAGFYVIPLLYELRFTYHPPSNSLMFLHVQDLLYSPWLYGFLFQGNKGQLVFFLGYPSLIILLIAIIFLVKKKVQNKDKIILLLSFVILAGCVFMMIPLSQPLWYMIPFLKNFQFTYRLLGVTMFCIAIIAALTVQYIKNKKYLLFICLFIIFSTILNWGNRRNVPFITDQVLEQQVPYTNSNGGAIYQAITKWSDPKHPFASHIPAKHAVISQGKGTITEVNRNNITHTYVTKSTTQLQIRENTLFFPGWNVYIDGKQEHIYPVTNSVPRGIISFNVPKGKHTIVVIFQDTLAVVFGRIVSIVGILLLGVCFFLQKGIRKLTVHWG